ncbi:hypothetical protein HW555_006561 [Spodoptera exigua]|uniref:Uncharacterized protein n=1 Tax=Spodoptera exigua TaxID=7107 RepID=A0A835GER1_SPOEX|nr:hypothetical protein HW555_006561 [Spodoptera exigua]
MFSFKISIPCAVLCVLTLCYGHENTTMPTSTQALATTVTATTLSDSSEADDSASDEWISNDKDLDQDATIWRFWRPFRKLGESILNKKFARSPTLKESGHRGLRYHQDKPNRKLKNKIKFLFKIKQFEM